MASPFQKYQGEQVQQIAPGFIEAYGRAGQSIGAGIASLAENVTKGYLAGQEKAKEEAKVKGLLKTYIQNDEKTKAANEYVRLGYFVKNSDGTVGVSAEYADKVNMSFANPIIEFYNKTGGDGSKLSGDALNEFAATYEGERKFKSEQAAIAAADVERRLKEAQIKKLDADAAAKGAEVGFYGNIGRAYMGVAPTQAAPSPTMMKDVEGAISSGASISAKYTTPFEDIDLVGQPTKAPTGATQPQTEPAAPGKPVEPVKATTPVPAAPAPKVQQKPTEAVPGAPEKAAAVAPAPAAAPQVQFNVAEEGKRVSEKLASIQTRRAAIVAEREQVVNKLENDHAATLQAIARTSIPKTQGATRSIEGLRTFQAREIEIARKRYDDRISSLDNEVKQVESDWQIYQKSAAEGKSAEQTAYERGQDVKKEKAAAVTKLEEQIADYPNYSVFVHSGAEMVGRGENPATYGIAKLDAKAKGEARELSEGWVKGTDFLMRLDNTIQNRARLGDDYSARFRLTTKDMTNYYEAELSRIFGVATFRRAIVSGGNFSDSDREFVMKAIAYLNSADPINNLKDQEKAVRALAVFVDAMYRKGLEGYDMYFNKDALMSQADKLEKGGYRGAANQVRSKITETERFSSRFNIKIGSGSRDSVPDNDPAINDARKVLWNVLSNSGMDMTGISGSAPK